MKKEHFKESSKKETKLYKINKTLVGEQYQDGQKTPTVKLVLNAESEHQSNNKATLTGC